MNKRDLTPVGTSSVVVLVVLLLFSSSDDPLRDEKKLEILLPNSVKSQKMIEFSERYMKITDLIMLIHLPR